MKVFITLFASLSLLTRQAECQNLCTASSKTATSSLTSSLGDYQTLENPGWPNAYLTVMDCKWEIDSGDPNAKVLLDFTSYAIEAGPGCSFDSLTIYNGKGTSNAILVTLCGNAAPGSTYTSSGQFITLRMRSDFSVQYAGFSVKYMSGQDYSGTGCSATQELIANATNATAPEPDYISSPGFPSTLSGTYSCSWVISPASPINNVTLTFLFSDLDCSTDSVKIYEGDSTSGTLLVNFCETRQSFPPSQVTFVAFATAYVTFTYSSGSKHGFLLSYIETESGFTTPAPPTTTTTPAPVTECGTTTVTASSSIQYITSPDFPTFYTNNLDCTWLIQSPTGTDIQLEFLDFFIEESDGCLADSLIIYDGDTTEFPALGTFCGETFSNVNSTSNSLLLKFTTDQSYTERGFHLSFIAITHDTPTCLDSSATTYELNATRTVQYLTSPGYPNTNYNSSSKLQWLIYNPTDSGDIIIHVADSRVEASKDCVFDKVTVYKGACTSYPVLGSFCGAKEPIFYQDAGKYVLIVFETDVNVEFRGFNISYVLGEAPEEFPFILIIGLIIGPILAILVLGGIIWCIVMAYRTHKRKHRFTRIRDGDLEDTEPRPGPSSDDGTTTPTTVRLPPMPDTMAKLPPIDKDLLYKVKLPPISRKKKK